LEKNIKKRWIFKNISLIILITGILITLATVFAYLYLNQRINKTILSSNVSEHLIFVFYVLIVTNGLVIAVTAIFGIKFLNGIIKEIAAISIFTKKIAQGDFSIKITKKHNDEIGELCDTINYLVDELSVGEKMKNEFLSSISHELRTPLTAIKGWAETIQLDDTIDTTTKKRGLDVIVSEAERLSLIVGEILDFSRLQNGKMIMKMDKIDILAELGEAVYMFKDRAQSEKKVLIYNEPKMLPPILGDKNRLKQVFINIIDNALKYTSKNGGISVSVSEKNSKILVSVTDNGCGIPINDLPKVTEKFYKVDQNFRGSGIGLAIVDEIIAQHNGTLEILSEEGFGTTVNIFLPCV
jgi:signal transduction histidine kinase